MPEDFLDPKTVLKNYAGLRPGMTAADFGCGSGGWAIPIAEILEGGKVYAIDIQEEPLSVLRSLIKARRIFNIEVIRMDVEKTILRLLANSVDFTLLSNVLFQVSDRKRTVEEAARILRPDGKLLVIDWEKDAPAGPDSRISAEEVRTIADGLGLVFKEAFKAGGYHYGLVFQKSKNL
jgi:ubiquinone/menaquinone biosynthesis C-methylase UbiE